MLRSTLAGHTGVPGALLDFTLGAFGKPTLTDPAGGGNAGRVGFGAGIGVPCGAAAISEPTIVPCASQSLRPSPPVM